MPNGRDRKKLEGYGGHSYDDEDTSDCKYGCGCRMGPAKAGGPVGIDPFGTCPGNPLDGKAQAGDCDYADVVEGRIKHLESEVYELKPFKALVLKAKGDTRIDLQRKVVSLESQVSKLKWAISVYMGSNGEAIKKLGETLLNGD